MGLLSFLNLKSQNISVKPADFIYETNTYWVEGKDGEMEEMTMANYQFRVEITE